jgi:hypothetical protein
MFCWSCPLAQEVRMANLFLDVEAGSVHRRDSDGGRADAGVVIREPTAFAEGEQDQAVLSKRIFTCCNADGDHSRCPPCSSDELLSVSR